MSRSAVRAEAAGLALVACALVFGAIALRAEPRIGRVPLNDAVFHLAAAERLGEAVRQGEPFLDPWVSEWSLGYPVWRSYQPLPHLVAAACLDVAEPASDHATSFAWLQYVLLVLLPASVYAGSRLLGLGPTASGLASLLVLAPAGAGDLGRFGLGYGAFVWRGSGLFTQLVALHALALALGFAARALDTGRHRAVAALLVAATALSHIVFGYVAFASVGLLALVGPAGERSRRLVRLATIVAPALAVLAWFVVPLALSGAEVNHSRWEAPWKWDSFGAPQILGALVSGQLLDAGRGPWLSILCLAGALAAVWRVREPLPRRLVALATLCLALFFGRDTWGSLVLLAGVPADLPLHRLQAAFELAAVLLAAWGTDRLVREGASACRPLGWAVAAGAAVACLLTGDERAAFLREGALWGDESLAAFEASRADLDASLADVRALLAERPGRAAAGLAADWGGEFKVGAVPFFAFLTRAHVDQASFLYHAMSSTADLMPLRDEGSAAHAAVFGLRAAVAPASRPMPPYLVRRSAHGPFAVYEASREGYFGLVDVGARYTGPASTATEASTAWLRSPLPSAGVVIALEPGASEALPAVARWQPLPPPDPAFRAPCGRVVYETKQGETYGAHLALARACHAFIKVTWYPDLVATVDGARAPIIRVTPGFAAVAVPAGEHDVAVAYRPGPLKPILFVLGIACFLGFVLVLRSQRARELEERGARRLAAGGLRLGTPRVAAAVAVAALCLVALRPLFRGRLVAGHDSLEYPPRLVEFARVVEDGHVPPLWAPDLGTGHGQPLFEFAPPLLYSLALPFRLSGARLADSLQLGLVLLHAVGAVAVYRLGRRSRFSRVAAVAGAGAWLFAPYTALDLFVRSAFAEAAAVAVAPVALLALVRSLDRPSATKVALGGAAVALVVLAHNAAALLLLPAFGVVVLAVSYSTARRAATLAAGCGALAAGLGLSAFFWLPALLEKDFVKVDLLRQDFLRWSEHAIAARQLLWSPWGYGLSAPGTGDGMSFALGLVHLPLAVAGAVLAWRSRDPRRRAEAAALAAIAAAGAWLATDWSSLVWSNVVTLQHLAYPWRALLLPGLCLPLLAIAAFERLGPRRATGALAVLVLWNIGHTEPKGYLTFDDEYYAPDSIARMGLNTTTREEYEPRWVERRPPWAGARFVGLDGPLELRAEEVESARQRFTLVAAAATDVEAATFYYPGWTVRVDGSPVALSAAPVRGTIRFHVGPGEHRVVLELGPTPLRRSALGLSLASVVLTALGVGLSLGRRRGEPGRRRAGPGD
jgi:uncharacterized membrane protein